MLDGIEYASISAEVAGAISILLRLEVSDVEAWAAQAREASVTYDTIGPVVEAPDMFFHESAAHAAIANVAAAVASLRRVIDENRA